MTGVGERLKETDDKVGDLLRSAVLSIEVRQCVANVRQALAAEFPGADGEALWELIGLPMDEIANLMCEPDSPVADNYHRYRQQLEAAGNTEALGRFHQHVDGMYVYVKSGLQDDSGFRDVGAWRIDRNDGDFAGTSRLWLTLAGLYAYGLGPTKRAAVEADRRERAIQHFADISIALRTSESYGDGGDKYRGTSTTYGCILQLLADTTGPVPYFTRSGFGSFRDRFSVDDLRRDSNWDQLYEDIVTNRPGGTSFTAAERSFGDLVFEGVAVREYSSDLREAIEQSAANWIGDDEEVDYGAVERDMDRIYEELERGVEAGQLAAAVRDSYEDLKPEFIFDRGMAGLALDPRSPYSCR